jgi:hypothetical protein
MWISSSFIIWRHLELVWTLFSQNILGDNSGVEEEMGLPSRRLFFGGGGSDSSLESEVDSSDSPGGTNRVAAASGVLSPNIHGFPSAGWKKLHFDSCLFEHVQNGR